MGVTAERARQVSMVTLLLASSWSSMVGLFRARWRLLASRGARMELIRPRITTEVKWVGYRSTFLGPPVTLIKDTVRKVSLNISA